jgi:hypothetical protein
LPGGGLASVQAALEQVGGRWDLLVRPCKGRADQPPAMPGTYTPHQDIPGVI